MNAGYVLILAVLILGCAIATAGDRIGSKVGKARLRLFNLRPRETATLVTTISGGLVAASTLGILLAIDKSLRTGLFELESIQTDLATARQELKDTQQQKRDIQTDLRDAQDAKLAAQRRLGQLNQELDQVADELEKAQDQQALTEAQLADTEALLSRADQLRAEAEGEIARIEAELQDTAARQMVLQQEIAGLQSEREALRARTEATRQLLLERDRQLQANQAQLTEQETRLTAQTRQLEERERLLAALSTQQARLEQQLQAFQQDIQRLRERRIAISQGEILASAIIQVLEPDKVDTALLALLQEANRRATQLLIPGQTREEEPIINVSRLDLNDLRTRLQDGREYVVRVLSTGNYLLGEESVQVFIETIPNEVVFRAGEPIAATTINPEEIDDPAVVQQIYWLIEAARFRAQREGILVERVQIGDGNPETFINFMSKLVDLSGNVDIRAISRYEIKTSNPLILDLVVFQDGEPVFSTEPVNSAGQ